MRLFLNSSTTPFFVHMGRSDPCGLFAKRVLSGDSHHALAIASLRSLIQENMVHKCATRFPLPRPEKSGQSCATYCLKSALVVFLTSGKDGEIVRVCRQPNRAVSGRGRRPCRRKFLFTSILRCPLESAFSSPPVKIRSSVAYKLEVREEPYERPYWRDRPGHY